MSSRTIRVTVRGAFDALTTEQRATLLADADQHQVTDAAFTPDGTITYDIAARPFFTFRYAGTADDEQGIPAITKAGRAAAEAWLETRGYAYKDLTTQTTDLSEMKLGKRARRAP